jgi:hypothetical protein
VFLDAAVTKPARAAYPHAVATAPLGPRACQGCDRPVESSNHRHKFCDACAAATQAACQAARQAAAATGQASSVSTSHSESSSVSDDAFDYQDDVWFDENDVDDSDDDARSPSAA